MEEVKNDQIMLKSHVDGFPKETDFCKKTEKIAFKLPQGSNGVLAKSLYLSCDPYMRNRMSKTSIFDSFTLGQVILGFGVVKVMDLANPNFKIGDIVWGMTGWEEYSLITATESLFKIQHTDVPLSYYIGLLGMPGIIAYAGFYEICSPKKGETVYVSAASEAVGQLVGHVSQ